MTPHTAVRRASLPLPALALVPAPAKASQIQTTPVGATFAPGTPACTVTAGNGFCTAVSNGTGGNSLANWIQIYSTGSLTFRASGGCQVVVTASGTASGSFPSSEGSPVSWDFTTSGPLISVSYDVNYKINGVSLADPTGGGPVGTELKGGTSITITNQTVTSFSVTLTVTGATYFNVTIPSGHTLDLNPVSTTAATPEPATAGLSLGGALLLFARRKLRSKRS